MVCSLGKLVEMIVNAKEKLLVRVGGRNQGREKYEERVDWCCNV